MQLTNQGQRLIEDVARRHQVSVDAVLCLLQAVMNGGGAMAQFNHPELGGSGQWMQGGMTMVGDMFNQRLKWLVDSLCAELSNLLAAQPLLEPPPPPPMVGEGVSLWVPGTGGGWWPPELGSPSATGSQNQLRYAIFPDTRRLAIDLGGRITVYDTGPHQIGGIGQQQGSGASFSFTSQYGLVHLNELPIVSGGAETQNFAPPPAATMPEPPPPPPMAEPVPFAPPMPESSPPSTPTAPMDDDLFARIERLAELHQRGIVSDEEFQAKKAEWLSRL